MASQEEEYQQFVQIRAELEASNDTLRNMNRQLKDLAGVGKLIKSIDSEISKSFKEANEFQKKSLGLGTNINKFTSDFSRSVDTLSGGLAGYGTALQESFKLYEAGIRDNSEGMAKLALFTKATGGNSAALAKALGKSIAGTGMSVKAQDKLGMRTIELSQRFGVSTGQLVNAIEQLGQDMDNLKALGLGEQAIEATTRLSAALGPQMATVGPQLLASFSKGNSMVQATLLGITNERRAFLSGSAEAGLQMVAKAGENAENIINRYINAGMDPAFALQKASDVYGKEVVTAYNAQQELRKQAEKAGAKSVKEYLKQTKAQEKINEDFANTISSIRDRIFAPIQKATTFVARLITAFLNLPIIGDLTVIVGQVVTSITALGVGILGVIAGFRKLVSGIVRLVNTLTESVRSDKQNLSSRDRLKIAIEELRIAINARKRGNEQPIGFRTSLDPATQADQRRNQDIHRTANQQRSMQIAKLGAVATSLGLIASVFGDNLPEWAQTSIGYATTASTLVTAIAGLKALLPDTGGGEGGGMLSDMKDKAKEKLKERFLGGGDDDGGGGGAGGGGKLGGLSKGIGKFGNALKGFVGGVGKAIAEAFRFIGKGIAYLGKPAVMKGAVSMILLATALIPLAGALNMMKGIKMATVTAMGAALLVLGAAAIGFGLIMNSGIGAVAIFLGAAAIAALGAALIPFAYAAQMAAPMMEALAAVIGVITPQAALGMMALGVALPMVAAGLAALTAGAMIAKIGAFFGADPFAALYKLGEAASPIVEMANSLGLIAQQTKPATEALKELNNVKLDGLKKEIKGVNFAEYAKSLLGLDRKQLFQEMVNRKISGAESLVESDGFKGKVNTGRVNPFTKQQIYDSVDLDHVNSEGQAEVVKGAIAALEMAKLEGSTMRVRNEKENVRMQMKLYDIMVKIENNLAGANEQREVANETRNRQLQESSRDKTRPSNYVGQSSPSDLE